MTHGRITNFQLSETAAAHRAMDFAMPIAG